MLKRMIKNFMKFCKTFVFMYLVNMSNDFRFILNFIDIIYMIILFNPTVYFFEFSTIQKEDHLKKIYIKFRKVSPLFRIVTLTKYQRAYQFFIVSKHLLSSNNVEGVLKILI